MEVNCSVPFLLNNSSSNLPSCSIFIHLRLSAPGSFSTCYQNCRKHYYPQPWGMDAYNQRGLCNICKASKICINNQHFWRTLAIQQVIFHTISMKIELIMCISHVPKTILVAYFVDLWIITTHHQAQNSSSQSTHETPFFKITIISDLWEEFQYLSGS